MINVYFKTLINSNTQGLCATKQEREINVPAERAESFFVGIKYIVVYIYEKSDSVSRASFVLIYKFEAGNQLRALYGKGFVMV